ncbi:MAG TPA: helix-turn-helix domain-containing protein [Chloroflexota bacterium]|nr:helix-turn-helix domain-containing protein [Chloroflexota bacterium]
MLTSLSSERGPGRRAAIQPHASIPVRALAVKGRLKCPRGLRPPFPPGYTSLMVEPHLLTLEEAAARAGLRKRDVRRLVIDGRLPAVRADGRWRIAAADLDRLPIKTAPNAPITDSIVPEADPDPGPASELSLVLDMLRERDRHLNDLQDERARLSSQVGFLLGRLSEREERIQLLEQDLLAAGAVVRETVITATQPDEDSGSGTVPLSALPAPDPEEVRLAWERSTTSESLARLPAAPDTFPDAAGAIVLAQPVTQAPSPPRKRNWLAVLIWGSYDS